jgi:hypothetical protein
MLRLYRIVPRSSRLRLVRLLPPHRQLWLIRWATQQRPSRRPARPGGLIRVRDAGHALRARVVAGMAPIEAWRHNLDAVTAALERAGVDHFCVRALDDQRSAVAVDHHDRESTLAALHAADELAGAQIRPGHFDKTGFRPGRRRPTGLQVFVPFTDPRGTTVYGSGSACEIEFWRTLPGKDGAPATTVAPRRNRFAAALPLEASTVRVGAATLSPMVEPTQNEPRYRTRSEFAETYSDDVRFPVDVVYTWVDGSDPEWLERKNAALAALGQGQINRVAADQSRFTSRNELKYSLRSIAAFAPWVRHIYLVTDDQIPAWLDAGGPRLTVVPHRELFGDTGALPTFNSHAIESRLHRIPGLAECFLYFNDDMFLGRPVPPTAFFHANGLAKFFPSPAQLEAGPATVHDAPVSAAGKNNRRHVEELFERCIAQKMMHVPYPLLKSVLAEIEAALPEEVRQTAAHPFRHPRDLSIPSSLAHYWAYHTRRAVPGALRYTYADLANPGTPVKLARLLARRHCDVFCLNDTDSVTVAAASQTALLADFLPRYFPFRSPFELPDEVTAERATQSATALGRSTFGRSRMGASA